MRAWSASVVAAIVLATAGCTAQEPGVQATRSRQNEVGATPTPADTGTPSTDQPTDSTPAPAETTPATTTPDTTPPDTSPIPVEDGVIDFGQNHRANSYDGFLTAALKDIESFWKVQFPPLYGTDFRPLTGQIYAAYPDRSDPIPGCGTRITDYNDIEGNAFYCVDGDFMAYDDAELVPQLVNSLGRGAVGVVLAHEFGHAVQSRANEFDQSTILKEQQADCFAGAWAAHIARGENDLLTFTDKDIRSGLIAMIQVRDPLELGGVIGAQSHGTGFDRVGAFQDGFNGGVDRCKQFFTENRQLIAVPAGNNGGDLPLIDPNPDPAKGPSDIVTLLPKDLNRYWTAALADENLTFKPPTVTVFNAGDGKAGCQGVDESTLNGNITYCKSNNTIFIDQQFAEDTLNGDLQGDMSVGYLISQGYSEIVQGLMGSKLKGEPRALLDDCLTGSWIHDDLPASSDPNAPVGDHEVFLTAGDLDEAIVTAIKRSDPTSDTNIEGSAFEKTDAFRTGVLGGLSACQGRLSP
jgi:predicted metalloprotease